MAQGLVGTLGDMGEPLHASPTASWPLHGTVRVEAPSPGPMAMPPHRQPGGAQGYPVVVDMVGGACRGRGLLAPGIEGDDGGDGFGLYKLVDAERIQPAVVDDSPHGDGQGMRRTGLHETLETGWPHGEVGARGGGQPDVDRQRMLRGDAPVLKRVVSEKVGVPVRLVPPGG